MRKVLVAAATAVLVSGCGGPVLGTTDATQPEGRYATPLTYGLPVAYFPITIKRDDKCTFTVALDKAVMARDPRWNFRLNYYHHDYTADTLNFQTDDVGLLMAINTTSESQIEAIINQAFSVAAQAAGFRLGAAPPPACTSKPFSVTYAVNPLDAESRKALTDLVSRSDPEPGAANVTIDEPTMKGAPPPGDLRPCEGSACTAPFAGAAACTDRWREVDQCIYFRRSQTYAWHMHDARTNTDVTLTFQAPAPQVYAIVMRRQDLVKFDLKLTFNHGVLTGYNSTDPSKIVAVLQIPSDLIKDVLGLDTPSSGGSGHR